MASAYLDWPVPLAFSHRGAGQGHLENTLAAFESVARLGYKYLETDVRTTRDGRLITCHDGDLARLHGIPRRIEDLFHAEFAALIGDAEARPPLLVDVLGAFPELRFNIDLKDERGVPAIAAALDRTRAHGRVCVTSFSDSRITRARRLLGPGVCTGAGVGAALRVGLQFLRHGRVRVDADVLQFPFRAAGRTLITRRLVRAVRASGRQLHVWTLNDEPSIAQALDLGVDGIMTDTPSLLRSALLARGAWRDA
jgi:glycerophosphoryl diester phosphodiesterase